MLKFFLLPFIYPPPQSICFQDFYRMTVNFYFIGMIETETKIQSAIWELVTTEVDYIHALQTVRDVSERVKEKGKPFSVLSLHIFTFQPIV
jgi:hypothetical protein